MSLENFPRGENKLEINRPTDGSFEKQHESEKYTEEEEIEMIDEQYMNITYEEEEEMKEEKLVEWVAKSMARDAKEVPVKNFLSKRSVFLGRVSKIKENKCLEVQLPSGFEVRVKDVDVSKSYRLPKKMIQNECYPLSDLFKPGDYVVCCAKYPCRMLLDPICFLSMEPQLINLNVRPNDLAKGFKIIGSVKSKEDHGYIVDTGILNVTAFLATENIEEGKQYLPNTQLLCTVKEVETVGRTTVVKLSTKEEKLVSVNDDDVVSLDVLMPGTKFSLRVKTVIMSHCCVQLYFGKDIFAYIHQIYLKHPLSTYKPDTYVIGTLLYTRTETKLACFSELDDTFSEEKEKLNVGDIIEKAEVLYRETRGIFFKLSESGLRGYVHFRKVRVPAESIETVFKEGSIHKCRVVCEYNLMEYLYLCTIDEEVLSSTSNGGECDIVPKSASEHFVTESPTENKQELRQKRVSESHDVDLANPAKKFWKDTYKMYMHTLSVDAEAWKMEFEKFIEKVNDKYARDIQTLSECSPPLQKDDEQKILQQNTQQALESLAESRRLFESCYFDCFKKSKDLDLNEEFKKRKRRIEKNENLL